MRFTFAFLLLCGLVLPASMNAQLGWSKRTYNVTGIKVERGDFTGDGFPDLLVYGGNDITVIPNAGNGTFDVAHAHSFSNQFFGTAALADFNRDGKMDVAGCTNSGVEILEGNGDGSLSFLRTIETGCSWVAAADFNGDGNPDLAVGSGAPTRSTGNQVSIYLGDGHGGFSAPVINNNVDFTSSEGNACSLNGRAIAADFTGDKVPDLFITADCPNFVVSSSAVIVGKGDGTGHFTFHRDIETSYDSDMNLRLTEGNNDGKNDVVAVGQGSAPHGAGSSALVLFLSHGDGTFESKQVAGILSGEPGGILKAGAFVDFDGDGIKDGIAMIDSFDDLGNETMTMQFYKGQPDGTYKLTQTSPLASWALDMVWGDYDKKGRADLALVRPNSTDVWLNTTTSAPPCGASPGLRTLSFCFFNDSPGMYRFFASPLDNLQINAMQIYVDGAVKFQTPDDFLSTKLQIGDGTHRITLKAWDDQGAFSNTTNVTVCTNSTNRSVRICAPQNGIVTGNPVHVLAAANTSLGLMSLQLYVDGILKFQTTLQTLKFDVSGLSTGTHHFTVKGWDSSGAFSSAVSVTVH